MINFISLSIAFWMAFITFYVNQRVHKLRNIKVLINTLFHIYGNPDVFSEFDPKDIPSRLMDEIINVEKLNDDNFYIDLEIKKLRKLRLAFFNHQSHNNNEITLQAIKDIKFQRLDKSFIILAFLDIKIPFIYER